MMSDQPKVTRRTLDAYKPHPSNPNRHTERGLQIVEDSVNYNGAGRSGLAAADGTLLAGNGTWEAMERAGVREVIEVETDGHQWVIVKRNDLAPDDARAKALMISDNRSSELGYDPSQEMLGALLADIAAQDAHLLRGAGYTEGELTALLRSLETPTPDAGAQVDRAAELQQKWQVRADGDEPELWVIPSKHGGEHRLLCGDSTKPEHVARLMGGDCAEMTWTDPPYGVSVGDKNKFLNSIARSNRIEDNLENDTLDEPALVTMLSRAFDNVVIYGLAGGACYVAAPPGPLHILFGQVLKDRGIWRQTIQWVKNNATFAPLGVDYHWRAEPIFYGWLPGAAHRWYGGRQQDTVWNIDRPMASPEHPTMKPVELVTRAIENSSQHRELVYDPFLGSGTTLVACEQTGRQGRGIEIAEKYCAVILQRLADLGLTPARVE